MRVMARSMPYLRRIAMRSKPRATRTPSGAGPRGRLWGPPGDPVLRSDPPSTLVQEPIPGDWPRDWRDRARHTSAIAADRDAGSRGAVLVVLALGLVLRLIIAYLLPGSGFEVDLGAFRYWASNLASEGLNGFYGRDFFHDYTPGYLYVLWLVGIVGNALGGVGDLIKIPPILADLGIGYLAWSMVRELGGRDRLALAAAAVAVLNPISWFDSVVWGQADSFGVVFVLLGLRELWRDRPERAAIYTVIAAIIKPQLGILIPIVAVVTIRRALWPAGGFGDPERDRSPDPDPDDRAGRVPDGGRDLPAVRAVRRRVQQPAAVPDVGPARAGRVAAGGYPYLTVNAYNPWALVPSDIGQSLANAGAWVCDYAGTAQDCGAGTAVFGPIPAVVIGTTLLLAVIGSSSSSSPAARTASRCWSGWPSWPSPSSWSRRASTSATAIRSSRWA